MAVSRTEKVAAKIPVVTFGESQLEKLNEGKIMLIKDEVEVEALPQDLPSKFEGHTPGVNTAVIRRPFFWSIGSDGVKKRLPLNGDMTV